MNTPLRLGLYGLGLVAVFAASFFTAGAISPDGSSGPGSPGTPSDPATPGSPTQQHTPAEDQHRDRTADHE